MRRSILFLGALGTWTLVALGACSNAPSDATNPMPDAAPDATDATDETASPDAAGDTFIPPPPGPRVSCTLDTGDPVAFCTQKKLLLAIHANAFVPQVGVLPGYSATTFGGAPDAAGMVHDPMDDVRYAARIDDYHALAQVYGDDEATATLDADLGPLTPLVLAEFATLPTTGLGELYADLRKMSGALRRILENDAAAQVDAVAEKVGRAIASSFVAVPGDAPVACAGGTDGGVSEAGASDAGDAGASDAGAAGGGVFGLAHDGVVEYAPVEVARDAVALLDMSVRDKMDPAVATWISLARASLDHLTRRATDGVRGYYYARLVTDPDPLHDKPILATGAVAADAIRADDQVTIALAFVRADAIEEQPAFAGQVPCLRDIARAEAALAAMDTAPALWDSTGFGYQAGLRLSTGDLRTEKTTVSNALAFAAIYHVASFNHGPEAAHTAPLRNLLLGATPIHSSLFSVLLGQTGYFAETSKTFDFPDDAGITVERAYSTSSTIAVCEALTELWNRDPL